MKLIIGLGATTAAGVAAVVAGVGAIVVLSVGAVGTTVALDAAATPSAEAVSDIPPALLPIFIAESAQCDGLPWSVLAAVSKVESDHGRFNGAAIGVDGAVTPPIIGPTLDGTDGNLAIADTDHGRWDNDPTWDHAVGPMQFIPTSWRIFGADASGDGEADPHNIYDSLRGARHHLCPEGRITDIAAALRAYNNSDGYVRDVLDWSQRYTATPVAPVDGYALPLPAGAISDALYSAPHHDYPAWDASVPVGTQVFAIADGTIATAHTAGTYPADPSRCGTTVAIAGDDGANYIYCHLSQLLVVAGQRVEAGTMIGLSGGAPGTRGAGNTTGPHIHVGIRIAGRSVCPQPVLLAIRLGRPLAPSLAPHTGCIAGQPLIDWSSWVAKRTQ